MNSTPQVDVVAYGEVLWDLPKGQELLGGAPANFAYRLHSLGNSVALISRVGSNDLDLGASSDFGSRALSGLASAGISTEFIQRDSNHPSGTVPVVFHEGDPTYVITPGVAYDHIQVTPEMLALAAQAKIICFGSLIQRSETSRETLYQLLDNSPQAEKLLDINLRPECYSPATIEKSLSYANILKLNRDEAIKLAKMFSIQSDEPATICRTLMEKNPALHTVLMTVGSKGVFAFTRAGEELYAPGHQIELKDAIGAGDSFTAAFIHKRLAGENLQTCCEYGNIVGALVASRPGGMAPVSLDEIREFRGLHHKLEAPGHDERPRTVEIPR